MKILLATDGTEHSFEALNTVQNFNLGADDELKIISVIDMAVPLAVDLYGGYLPVSPEIEKASRENAERIIDKASQHLRETLPDAKFKLSTDILFGSPESRIVETAEEFQADLIIVGSHGYNRWERLLLGSVSDSVVHHAPCSVLVVRLKKSL